MTVLAFVLGLGLLRECDVTIGQIVSCSATTFTGAAVVVHTDDRHRRCKIANGRAHECAGWYSGDAPAYVDGRWRQCEISTGRVFSCDATGYTGTVVASRPG